jgi:hypothetical protein
MSGMIECVDLDLETWIVQSIALIKVVTLKMIFQKSLTGEAIQKMMDLILMGVSQIEIQKETGTETETETEKDIGIIIMQGKGQNTIAKCQNAQLITGRTIAGPMRLIKMSCQMMAETGISILVPPKALEGGHL